MTMSISRPTLTVVASPSGKKFTFEVASENWVDEFQSLLRFDTKAQANSAANKFGKEFEAEASDIEAGRRPRYLIMPTLCEHGKFKQRRRLSSNFS